MKTEKVYQITKDYCQQTIDKSNCVCSYCGGVLEPIETVDNGGNPTYWTGCNSCGHFNTGVEKYVFDIAKCLVSERNYRAYSYEREPIKGTPEHTYWLNGQVGGMSRQVNEIIMMYKSRPENLNLFKG